MNILLISYGDLGFDGRLRELRKVFQQLGEVYMISRGEEPESERQRIYKGEGYLKFIWEAVAYARKIKKIDVLALDNRKATIPGMIIRLLLKPRAVVQDCRELYILNEVRHLSGKIGCVAEKYSVQRADIVISANQDRAEIMQQMYGLKKCPLVYENLRMLEYSNVAAEQRQSEKFGSFIKENEIRIISTSGCLIDRGNGVLVENLKNVTSKCRLFLVGDSTPGERREIEEIAKRNQVNNVEIIGRLNQDELKYLIRCSHIGIVNYHQEDQNNKYCASGKLFEFIYEGVPVVTTTNPPLKRLCDEARIGVADDRYAQGINAVIENYAYYQGNAQAFAEKHTVLANNERLVRQLKEEISRCLQN